MCPSPTIRPNATAARRRSSRKSPAAREGIVCRYVGRRTSRKYSGQDHRGCNGGHRGLSRGVSRKEPTQGTAGACAPAVMV
jgi:hypothetical protein